MDDRLVRDLTRLTYEKQNSWRAPGLFAAIVRDGAVVWSVGVGAADVERPQAAPDPQTAFAIGSNTKTFTATLIMRQRDAGTLRLSDPIGTFIPGLTGTAAQLPIRELLAHASGLQREPIGDIWDDLEIPDIAALIADTATAEQVLPARLRWHYSNLAFALLGEVAARLSGTSWFEAVRTQLLQPLGMTSTADTPPANRATGYYVDPFADRVRLERWPAMGAFTAAGGLWSTADDLARWAQFLAVGADDVLAAQTVEEMTRPEIMADLDEWTQAWGLGLQLNRIGNRVLVGHGGSMPGFLSGLQVRRSERVAAIVWCNSSANAEPVGLAGQLLTTVLDADPSLKQVWRPGPAVPAEIEELLGRWWSEGEAYEFAFRDGTLQARLEADPPTKPPAVFTRIETDVYRGVSGREEGELLRIERDEDGGIARMRWATYPVTREPETF